MTRDPRTVMQLPGNWSDHVTSWVRAEEFGLPAPRHEDFQSAPEAGFETVPRLTVAPGDIVARIAADHGPVMKRHGYLA